MVVSLGEFIEIGIVAHQTSQGAFGERIVAELFVFHHTGTEEGIAQQEVSGLFGLGGEGNLREIVFTCVRIEGVFAFFPGIGGVGRGDGGFARKLCGIVSESCFESFTRQSF